MSRKAFKLGQRYGLVFFTDLFIDNNFTTFDHIYNYNNIPRAHFFRYLEVQSVAKRHFPSFPGTIQYIHYLLDHNPYKKGLISKVYITIQYIMPLTWADRKQLGKRTLGKKYQNRYGKTA